MNRRHLNILLASALLLAAVAGSATSNAAEIPAEVAAAMKAAGVPMYPGAVYCLGDVETGMRIAAGDDPNTVRACSSGRGRRGHPGDSRTEGKAGRGRDDRRLG